MAWGEGVGAGFENLAWGGLLTPLLLGGLIILTWVANYCGGALQEPGVGVNTHLQLLNPSGY